MNKQEIIKYLQEMQDKYYRECNDEYDLHNYAMRSSNRSKEYKEEKQYRTHYDKAMKAKAVLTALDEIIETVIG